MNSVFAAESKLLCIREIIWRGFFPISAKQIKQLSYSYILD